MITDTLALGRVDVERGRMGSRVDVERGRKGSRVDVERGRMGLGVCEIWDYCASFKAVRTEIHEQGLFVSGDF